jgi:hypothetical protein
MTWEAQARARHRLESVEQLSLILLPNHSPRPVGLSTESDSEDSTDQIPERC